MARFFTLLFTSLLCITMIGCSGDGGDGYDNIDIPPPISEAKRIAIVPFFAKTGASEDVEKLAGRIGVNLATRLELIFKEAEWVYDISNKVQPVADKLTELGLTPEQVYGDPALAAKLGQELGSDMVIIGSVEEPKMTDQDYNQLLMKQGRQGGISGTSTYIRTRLTARGLTRVRVIDANSIRLFSTTGSDRISSIGTPIRPSRANSKYLRAVWIDLPI